MRGEHSHGADVDILSVGSSPHARGARGLHHQFLCLVGIIPACAGSTRPRGCRSASRWDHPRMRGEHLLPQLQLVLVAESSSHARRAHGVLHRRPRDRGIIPACAGSTSTSSGRACRRRDHPRMRGEHGPRHIVQPLDLGSSPHARGAPQGAQGAQGDSGIIPACTGSTWQTPTRACTSRDHPRMRGEHVSLVNGKLCG